MNRYFVICDCDRMYAMRFAEYLLTRKICALQVEIFTDQAMAAAFCRSHRVKYLLIHEALYAQSVFLSEREPQPEHIFLFTEDSRMQDAAHIYKYQAMTAILEQMQLGVPRAQTGAAAGTFTRYIGVYSPVRRALHTPFALAIACSLAQQKETLYLNLQAFSGAEVFLGKSEGPDLSDIMYDIQIGRVRTDEWGRDSVLNYHQTDYLMPTLSPEDLQQIPSSAWQKLLDAVEVERKYRYVVLELSAYVQGFWELLERCAAIYMPVEADVLSEGQEQLFEKLLSQMQQTGLAQRIHKLRLPNVRCADVKQLETEILSGGLADCAYRVLKDDGYGG